MNSFSHVIVVLIAVTALVACREKRPKAERPEEAPFVGPPHTSKGSQKPKPAPPPASSAPMTKAEMEKFDRRARAVVEANEKLFLLERDGKLVGATLVELERLIGPPTSTEGQTVTYLLDTGFGGWAWKFEHRDGKVTGVIKNGIN